jgi:hypothetical protein
LTSQGSFGRSRRYRSRPLRPVLFRQTGVIEVRSSAHNAALESDPAAAEFFDGLPQFYRSAYLRWIDATKERPDERAARIREVVALLTTGTRQRL